MTAVVTAATDHLGLGGCRKLAAVMPMRKPMSPSAAVTRRRPWPISLISPMRKTIGYRMADQPAADWLAKTGAPPGQGACA